MVSQIGSISSPIHNKRGIHFYNTDFYAIKKSTATP